MAFFLANLIIIVLIIGILAGSLILADGRDTIFFATSPGSLGFLNRNREIPLPAKGKPGFTQDLP